MSRFSISRSYDVRQLPAGAYRKLLLARFAYIFGIGLIFALLLTYFPLGSSETAADRALPIILGVAVPCLLAALVVAWSLMRDKLASRAGEPAETDRNQVSAAPFGSLLSDDLSFNRPYLRTNFTKSAFTTLILTAYVAVVGALVSINAISAEMLVRGALLGTVFVLAIVLFRQQKQYKDGRYQRLGLFTTWREYRRRSTDSRQVKTLRLGIILLNYGLLLFLCLTLGSLVSAIGDSNELGLQIFLGVAAALLFVILSAPIIFPRRLTTAE